MVAPVAFGCERLELMRGITISGSRRCRLRIRRHVIIAQGVERLDQRVVAAVELRPPPVPPQRWIIAEDLLGEGFPVTGDQGAQVLRRDRPGRKS